MELLLYTIHVYIHTAYIYVIYIYIYLSEEAEALTALRGRLVVRRSDDVVALRNVRWFGALRAGKDDSGMALAK